MDFVYTGCRKTQRVIVGVKQIFLVCVYDRTTS